MRRAINAVYVQVVRANAVYVQVCRASVRRAINAVYVQVVRANAVYVQVCRASVRAINVVYVQVVRRAINSVRINAGVYVRTKAVRRTTINAVDVQVRTKAIVNAVDVCVKTSNNAYVGAFHINTSTVCLGRTYTASCAEAGREPCNQTTETLERTTECS